VLAFTRGERALIVVPRFTHELRGDWNDFHPAVGATSLPMKQTKAVSLLSVAALLERFPVALLTREEENL
jgi:hypothetical protein